MDSTNHSFVRSRPVWYAIVYDRQHRKRDYLDGFDTMKQAQIWLLRNLATGEQGEVEAGHTLRATGDARYYKEGQAWRSCMRPGR